jgi:hypothetical protein
MLEGDGVSPAAVGRLVDRELQLREAERFFPFQADAAMLEARLTAVEARVGGRDALARILDAGGMTPERLRAWIRNDLHVQAYVRQRFATEERRDVLLADWTADLRRRTTVVLIDP